MIDATTATDSLAFNGMVATPHELATAAGLAILRDGGSAIDAAICANAVLTVVYPDQTSIGGDCFLLYHEARSARLHALNGSGQSAAAASAGALRAAGFERMPTRGIHTVTVPGTVDAWATALERFGRFGLDRLLRPAIGYAREGFPVTASLVNRINIAQPVLREFPAIASLIAPDGSLPVAGSRLRLPPLAMALEMIARDGRDAFYRGPIASAIAATATSHGGLLSQDDLANHSAAWVDPLSSDYRGTVVAQCPPNSQGLTALIELNLSELVPVAAWGSADRLHSLIEAKKLAFDIRDNVLADPATTEIDTDHLVSKAFARSLWTTRESAMAGDGQPTVAGDTVYLCAVDRDGNAASLVQSIYQAFGSGIVVDGFGIVLQNRGRGFSLDPTHPNRFEVGKRPLHTLMPGMLYRDGHLLGPFGTQGGDAQAQIHLQLVTNLVDHAMSPSQAIVAPRWLAGGPTGDESRFVTVEGRFPSSTDDELERRGHVVHRTSDFDPDFGHAQMILRDQDTGLLRGAADPRADGLALGW